MLKACFLSYTRRTSSLLDLNHDSNGKEPACQYRVISLGLYTRVISLGWEGSLEKEVATHSVFLPGEFHRQRSLVSYSPWGHKESKTTEQQTLSRRL